MANINLVSFKLPPDHFTVLKALAAAEGITLSEYVRRVVSEGCQLEAKAAQLAEFFSSVDRVSDPVTS